MNAGMEVNILGIFMSGALLAAMIAAVLQFPARHLLTRAGVYALVWHRNLFDLSLYIILWGLTVWALSYL